MKKSNSKKDTKKSSKAPEATRKVSKLKPVKGKVKKEPEGSLNEEEGGDFDDLLDPDDLKLDDFSADGLEDDDADGFYEDEF